MPTLTDFLGLTDLTLWAAGHLLVGISTHQAVNRKLSITDKAGRRSLRVGKVQTLYTFRRTQPG